jgi:hypothetical protein
MAYRKNDAFIYNKESMVIELPHSCDNWVIGGVSEAKQMVKDLEKLIKDLENRL